MTLRSSPSFILSLLVSLLFWALSYLGFSPSSINELSPFCKYVYGQSFIWFYHQWNPNFFIVFPLSFIVVITEDCTHAGPESSGGCMSTWAITWLQQRFVLKVLAHVCIAYSWQWCSQIFSCHAYIQLIALETIRFLVGARGTYRAELHRPCSTHAQLRVWILALCLKDKYFYLLNDPWAPKDKFLERPRRETSILFYQNRLNIFLCLSFISYVTLFFVLAFGSN